MTSEGQEHDHDYSDDSSNEAPQEHGSPSKRRRVSQSWVNVSCQLCKTRKVKCNRTLPSCGWCTRNNAACEYKERKKPGLRAGYGRELEQRLDKLESILLQHSEVLARVLGQVPNGEEIPQHHNEARRSPLQQRCAIAQGQADTPTPTAPMTGLYESSHARRGSIGVTGQHYREFASALPPSSTTSPTHDRRPSVSFMNNPISPPPAYVKPSQSPPPFAHGVLKHNSSSPQYPPLLTPNTTTSSGAHSHHEYLSSQKQRREPAATPPFTVISLQARYPFNASCHNYINNPLPPWPVMYELSLRYFTHINSVLPLISESTIFEVLLDPRKLETDCADVKTILMAITVVAMRYLSSSRLVDREKDSYTSRCREELNLGHKKSKEQTQALAILLLGSNGTMGSDETAEILGEVNKRLSQEEKGREANNPQSPLSVGEMLCRS